jgi:Polyketide cyclase / dehydrase and lipid transport
MFLKIALIATLAIVVVITGIFLYADTRPSVIQVTRSITIQAPAEKIFPLIDDFHHWPGWAPQDKEDPAMKRLYSGEQSGAGAISDWQGTGNTGKGRMTITESTAPNKVVVKVDFVRPFAAHNINEFLLEPSAEPSPTGGTSTTVTWTMRGRNMFFMKLMGVFVNMDHMLGKHFESGLQNLKIQSES